MAEEIETQGDVVELEERIAQLEEALQAREGELQELREQMALTVAKYRAVMLANAPEIPEELIQGDTVEEIDASVIRAREVVERVKRQLEANRAKERVPTGAPARRGIDLSALSPREKIAHALSK